MLIGYDADKGSQKLVFLNFGKVLRDDQKMGGQEHPVTGDTLYVIGLLGDVGILFNQLG
jgi:hypothetical protein